MFMVESGVVTTSPTGSMSFASSVSPLLVGIATFSTSGCSGGASTAAAKAMVPPLPEPPNVESSVTLSWVDDEGSTTFAEVNSVPIMDGCVISAEIAILGSSGAMGAPGGVRAQPDLVGNCIR